MGMDIWKVTYQIQESMYNVENILHFSRGHVISMRTDVYNYITMYNKYGHNSIFYLFATHTANLG